MKEKCGVREYGFLLNSIFWELSGLKIPILHFISKRDIRSLKNIFTEYWKTTMNCSTYQHLLENVFPRNGNNLNFGFNFETFHSFSSFVPLPVLIRNWFYKKHFSIGYSTDWFSFSITPKIYYGFFDITFSIIMMAFLPIFNLE